MHSTYSTGQPKQVFDDGNNIDLTCNSLKEKKNVNLAYADLVDSISIVPIQFMKNSSIDVFTQARKLHDIPVRRLMAMTDDDLRKFFSRDKRIAPVDVNTDTIHKTVASAARLLDSAEGLFAPKERDEMIRAVAQLEVIIPKRKDQEP